MNNEDKIFNLLEKVYIELQDTKGRLGNVENKLDNVENRLGNVENRLENVEKIVVRIENEHGQKLDALFDGYNQNSDKLDRIETEVSKHEEIIMRRIR